MKNFFQTLSLVLGALLLLNQCGTQNYDWSRFEKAYPGSIESIGGYSNGCLSGAQSLKTHQKHYLLPRIARKRNFGHPTLIALMERKSKQLLLRHHLQLLISDLSQARGGPMKSGHRSHQNGLDADIWFRFLRTNLKGKHELIQKPEELQPYSVINTKKQSLSRHWSEEHGLILKSFAQEKEIQRIFVNPLIKRALCRQNPQANWLRKLRPWWGHHEHFHIRMKCLKNDPLCKNQDPVPQGSGCGSDLNWWFSAEAQEKRKVKKKYKAPKISIDCKKLYHST